MVHTASMASLLPFEPGGFRFLRGGFPYSAGVIAEPGFSLVRARFAKVMPVHEGFAAIEAHLRAAGRPLTALCAAELRSPKPFTFASFRAFNEGYVSVLNRWGLVRAGLNPVARSHVCPQFDAPPEPGFFAFSYTVPAGHAAAHRAPRAVPAGAPHALPFVVAGSGEWPEDTPFPQGIVARGDLSTTGLAAKATYVLRTMRERTAGLGGHWAALTAAQVYTAHPLHPLLASHLATEGLTAGGLTWHVCRPPIEELEFEMDVRSLATELVLGVG